MKQELNSKTPLPQTTMPNAAGAEVEGEPAEQQIAINGFQQVLEMLKVADPEFRESLLRRLAARDRQVAQRLREELLGFGL